MSEYVELEINEKLPDKIALYIHLEVDNSRCLATVIDCDTKNGSAVGAHFFDACKWEYFLDCIVTNIINVIRSNNEKDLS